MAVLYENRDKIQETRGRSACGAHFSPELLESLVSLFVVGLRPMWVIENGPGFKNLEIIK